MWLDRFHYILDQYFVIPSVDVHHAGVTLGHELFALWNLKNVDLALDKIGCWHHLVTATENITFLDLFLVSNIDLYFDIFTWTGGCYYVLLCIINCKNLRKVTIWSNNKLVSDSDCTALNFTVDNSTTVLEFIDDGDSKFTVWVSLFSLDCVESLPECWSLVPWAFLGVNPGIEVLACQTGNWYPNEIRVFVASFVQEWLKTSVDLVISFLRPPSIVHFVDNNNKLLNTQTLGQLSVFSCLTILLETGLEFTLSCRDDKTTEISH